MKLLEKKVVLLGGSGFLCQRIAHTLLQKGTKICSFDLAYPIEPISGVQYIVGDFFSDSELLAVVKDADIVIHGISTITPGNSRQCYMRGYQKDFIQTIKLCEYILQNEKKLLFLSSGGTVYGEVGLTVAKEEMPLNPINHYGSLKACIETVMQVFIRMGADIQIARIANPYGPGQDYRKGVGFIDAALKRAMNQEVIEVWGDGTIVRDYIYVDDACEMICDILEYEGERTVFNVSTGVGVSQNDILHEIKKLIPSLRVEYLPKRWGDVPNIVLSNEKIMNVYSKEIKSISDGIRSYFEYISKEN